MLCICANPYYDVNKMNKIISVCIPVYNEAKNLPVAIAKVEELFKREELKKYSLELIITDNASTDDTWKLITELGASRTSFKAYRFSRNFGYQNSIFAGLSNSTGDAVVELDADLEDPPEIILEFVKKWMEGFDVVYGVRRTRQTGWLLKLVFRAFYRILNLLSELPIPANSGDFRLLDRRVVNVLKALPERNLYLRGLVTYLGFKQVQVLYDRNPRLSGNSKFRLFHYIVLALDALTAFSKAPLRAISILGVLLFILAMGLAFYYGIMTLLYGKTLPGFATLVVLTLFLHSITFVFLGIIGEYLSRIFDDSKNRPRVIISEAIGDDKYPRYL